MMAPTVVLRDGGGRAGARQRRLEPHPLGDPADDRRRRRPRACAPTRRCARRALHFEDGVVYAEPGDRRSPRLERAGHAVVALPRAQPLLRRRAGGPARPATGALSGGGDPRRGGAVGGRREAARARRSAALAAAAALAGCGDRHAPDLFVVTRTGSIPGARLHAARLDDGTVRCNGGARRRHVRSAAPRRARDRAASWRARPRSDRNAAARPALGPALPRCGSRAAPSRFSDTSRGQTERCS